MPALFLMCGLPGAGKTTQARRLERERHALRLSPDEWIAPLLRDPSDIEELDRLRSPVESVQWEVAARVLALGVDVVLDWGFWSRAERDEYRARALALGARAEVHYFAVGCDALWARLSARNEDLPPGTFVVTEAQLDLWWGWFETPTAEELESSGEADEESTIYETQPS
jgi:predicted kinase